MSIYFIIQWQLQCWLFTKDLHFSSIVKSSYWVVTFWQWPLTALPNSPYSSVGEYEELSLLESGTHNLLAEVVKTYLLSLLSLLAGLKKPKQTSMFLRTVEAQDRRKLGP